MTDRKFRRMNRRLGIDTAITQAWNKGWRAARLGRTFRIPYPPGFREMAFRQGYWQGVNDAEYEAERQIR